MIYTFFDFTKTINIGFFADTVSRRSFKLRMIVIVFGGLAIYTRFDDLDLSLGSHVCQNHNLQIAFHTLVHRSLNGAWLLDTLKRSSTVCFV